MSGGCGIPTRLPTVTLIESVDDLEALGFDFNSALYAAAAEQLNHPAVHSRVWLFNLDEGLPYFKQPTPPPEVINCRCTLTVVADRNAFGTPVILSEVV